MIGVLGVRLRRMSVLLAATLLGIGLMLVSGSLVAGEHLAAGPDLTKAGADTCLGCHNDPSMQVIFRTPHGQQADPASPMAQLQCEACHGPGGEHADRRKPGPRHAEIVSFSGDNGSSPATQNAVCMDCHQNDVSLAWAGSVHERNEATCASCHSVHTKVDPVSLQAEQANVCFDCHQQQRADSLKPSAHPIRFNLMVCGDCHNPHASVSSGQLTRNTTNELCLECHQEYRGPMLFDHAPVSEDCSLCHQPHGSIHPALLTRRPPLLCQSCHSQAGHPSASFTSDSLPGGNPSVMVLERSCMNCHTQVHGSNHPSGYKLMR
ncbi:MAG: DmsE family decaheme c-type cytochrome [Gammaproteobacteria bacterium]